MTAADAPGKSPRVVAVMVTFERLAALLDHLRVLAGQTRPPNALVLVNNGAPWAEEEERQVRAGAEGVELVILTTGANLGPAGGLAVGVAAALDLAGGSDDVVLLLDDDDPPAAPDAIGTELALLTDLHRTDPTVAGVGQIGAVLDRRTGKLHRFEDRELTGLLDVDMIGSGQLPLYRAAALLEVDGHRGELFFGFEDLDLGLQLREAGLRLVIDGDLALRRRAALGRLSLSRQRGSLAPAWRQYYSCRNLVLIARRHGLTSAALCSSAFAVAGGLRAVVEVPRRDGVEFLLAVLRGVVDGWSGRTGAPVAPVAKAVAG